MSYTLVYTLTPVPHCRITLMQIVCPFITTEIRDISASFNPPSNHISPSALSDCAPDFMKRYGISQTKIDSTLNHYLSLGPV